MIEWKNYSTSKNERIRDERNIYMKDKRRKSSLHFCNPEFSDQTQREFHRQIRFKIFSHKNSVELLCRRQHINYLIVPVRTIAMQHPTGLQSCRSASKWHFLNYDNIFPSAQNTWKTFFSSMATDSVISIQFSWKEVAFIMQNGEVAHRHSSTNISNRWMIWYRFQFQTTQNYHFCSKNVKYFPAMVIFEFDQLKKKIKTRTDTLITLRTCLETNSNQNMNIYRNIIQLVHSKNKTIFKLRKKIWVIGDWRKQNIRNLQYPIG